MQIAEEDNYENHVICRGFDTRELRFVDYQKNTLEKPGISVAKPYGCRVSGGGAKRYRIGEVFPAFLPTQGSADSNPHYVPPVPVEVKWRLGQNSGTIITSPYGGHAKCLDDEFSALLDHNGLVINWMLVHSEMKMFRFQVIDRLNATTYRACVRQMSGYWPHEAEVYDPDKIFDGMRRGTRGLAMFQEGKYYVFNAKCNPEVLENCVCSSTDPNDCECTS
jgi:hypothetical protein